ncbi:MAG: chemotaxis protein [Candidatus Thiodiazotropha taylori]|nr:chemotaxis protein [Candidatus Thiodiazotropha taylori]MCW4223291.1 chemotaxis protein [Candidatus Thiodiazotropha endolucinida]MCG8034429.1 chemotaxis protein [Candidatus Thiodiazotropha taylori]MCG8076786.1 chemotaxis protein [Candidatus Thiodiazotropha taylori]MCG8115059.1 chemotaxis protein [Candidatus Thiodiazotropha taylori]
MIDYLIAMTIIPILLLGWLIVQSIARRFAKLHPEFAPPREEGAGCGKSCLCSGNSCQRQGDHLRGYKHE